MSVAASSCIARAVTSGSLRRLPALGGLEGGDEAGEEVGGLPAQADEAAEAVGERPHSDERPPNSPTGWGSMSTTMIRPATAGRANR
jgi:hypothetical protein